MQNHSLSVQKTARYYTLGTLNENTQELWFVVHGYAQLAEKFIEDFKTLDNGKRYIIAPEALNKFYLKAGLAAVGTTWMTREDRENEIKDYVAYLNQLYDSIAIGANVRITVLGFSQGVATTSRWLSNNPRRFDRLILWAGEIGNELQNSEGVESFKVKENYFVCGSDDQFIHAENMDKIRAMLQGFDIITFDGKHIIDTEVLNRLAN